MKQITIRNPDIQGIYHCWHYCRGCGMTWTHSQAAAPHFHNWEDGTYYSHSHKGGNVPHGHHGCRYGMPELPKLTKDSLEIKKDGVFDD